LVQSHAKRFEEKRSLRESEENRESPRHRCTAAHIRETITRKSRSEVGKKRGWRARKSKRAKRRFVSIICRHLCKETTWHKRRAKRLTRTRGQCFGAEKQEKEDIGDRMSRTGGYRKKGLGQGTKRDRFVSTNERKRLERARLLKRRGKLCAAGEV